MSKITNKTCIGCVRLKAADAFAVKKGSTDGLQSYCRDCQKERRAEWSKANGDKVAAYNAARRTTQSPSERPLRGGGEEKKKASEPRATVARASSAAAEQSETLTSGFADGNKEDSIAVVQTAGFANLPHAAVVASLTNPRKHFDREFIESLAASIRVHGLAQPILVRPLPGARLAETYTDRRKDAPRPTHEIVAGEQRWRACELAGVRYIPALIKDLTDQQVLEFQLIENLKRRDLHPMEEAEGYERLRESGMAVDEIAERIGKGRSYVYKTMNLLSLVPEARAAFYDGKLTKSTAELVAARQPNLQLQVLKEITAADFHGDGMSFRKAKAHVEERYMLRLGTATFKITDETLVPEAGSCRTCPKRSGANPDLFDDVAHEDTCTDPTCFSGKKEAHYARVRAQAEAKGQTVITGREAKEIMPDSNTMRGYTKVDDHQAFGGQMKTLRKVLGNDMPTPTLLEDPKTHEMIEVLPTAVVGKLLKDQGIAKAPTVESNEAAAKRRAAETFELEWRTKAIRAVTEVTTDDFDAGTNTLREIALLLFAGLRGSAQTLVGELANAGKVALREGVEQHLRTVPADALGRWIYVLTMAHDLHQLDEKAPRISAGAFDFDIDLAAIQASVKASMRKEISDQKVASAVAAVKTQATPAKPARKPKTTAVEAQAEIATQLQQASNPNSFSAGQRVRLKADLRRNFDVFKTKATEAEVVQAVGDRAWEVKPEALSFTLIADYTEMEAIEP